MKSCHCPGVAKKANTRYEPTSLDKNCLNLFYYYHAFFHPLKQSIDWMSDSCDRPYWLWLFTLKPWIQSSRRSNTWVAFAQGITTLWLDALHQESDGRCEGGELRKGDVERGFQYFVCCSHVEMAFWSPPGPNSSLEWWRQQNMKVLLEICVSVGTLH